MKALTVWQPWAWLIAEGVKDVENRTWAARYRGPLLIHAGKRKTDRELKIARIFAARHGIRLPDEMLYGGIVAVATLTDCTRHSESPWWIEGCYAWCLKDVRPLPFVPCGGHLGLWDIELPYDIKELAP